jgi:UDP-N-acetylmuramyl pentapeptide phosphotransferase/UDP-N-acetylglucosamine-1-phosphate transferase
MNSPHLTSLWKGEEEDTMSVLCCMLHDSWVCGIIKYTFRHDAREYIMVSLELTKVFTLTSISFILALFGTPLLTFFLYKYKLGKQIRDSADTPLFTKMHAAKKGTPTMGGILVWGSTVLIICLFWFLDRVVGWSAFHNLNILTRRETLLPLGAFLGAALVGLVDDMLDIYRMGHNGRGLRFRIKVIIYALVAAVGAWFTPVSVED